jgi:rod shape determining protein RodA
MANAMTDRSLRQIDWLLLLSVLALALLGIALVYSATSSPGSTHAGFHWRQMTWLGIGLVCAWGVAAVHYRVYDTLAWFGYAISIVLLILVFPIGTEVLGAKRWLRLGGFQFQPSELAKLWTIFVLARHLDQKRIDLSKAKNWVIPILITFVPMALVLKEPDLATSLSFFVFFVAMMFWAGMPITTLLLALSPVMSVGLFFLTRSEWPFGPVVVALLVWARPRLRSSSCSWCSTAG